MHHDLSDLGSLILIQNIPKERTPNLLFCQPQDHIPEHMPHQISLSIQNLLEPLSEIESRSSIKLVAGTAINEFYAGKIKRRLLDRKTENSKAPAKIAIHQPLLIM